MRPLPSLMGRLANMESLSRSALSDRRGFATAPPGRSPSFTVNLLSALT